MFGKVDRFTAGIVAVVLALIVVAVGVSLVARGREIIPDPASPGGVTYAYMRAMADGLPEQAWDLLAAGTKAANSRDKFIASATQQYPRGGEINSRFAIEDERITGSTATLQVIRYYGTGGGGLFNFGGDSTTTQSVRLVQEGGVWRITQPPDAHLLQGKG